MDGEHPNSAIVRTFRFTLAYDGTDFAGWQFQPGCRTVQETVEQTILKITGETIRVTASGRTDAGVHALAQVMGFRSGTRLSADVLLRAMNAELPADVAVLSTEEVPQGFHAIRDARRKRYRYVIHDGRLRDPLRRRYCWHIYEPLDADAMHRAAQALAGMHDFCSFESSGSERATTVRTIHEIFVRRGDFDDAGDAGDADDRPPSSESQHETDDLRPATPSSVITLEVEADGFLYNMVRSIVGTLVEIGRGARPPSWIEEVLAAADRRAAGQTAPPQGLFLVKVEY
jgi:tRNA pseudouridine38-40 synthase